MDAVLKVEGLRKEFGGLIAVNDVSFEIGEGEFVGLIGPNGCGKSTTFNCISGLLGKTGGKVAKDTKRHWWTEEEVLEHKQQLLNARKDKLLKKKEEGKQEEKRRQDEIDNQIEAEAIQDVRTVEEVQEFLCCSALTNRGLVRMTNAAEEIIASCQEEQSKRR